MQIRYSHELPNTLILHWYQGQVFVGVDEKAHQPVIDMLPENDTDRAIILRLLGEMTRRRTLPPAVYLYSEALMIIFKLRQPAAPVRKEICSLLPRRQSTCSDPPTEIMVIAEATFPSEAAMVFRAGFAQTKGFTLSVVPERDCTAPLWSSVVRSYIQEPPPITIMP